MSENEAKVLGAAIAALRMLAGFLPSKSPVAKSLTRSAAHFQQALAKHHPSDHGRDRRLLERVD